LAVIVEMSMRRLISGDPHPVKVIRYLRRQHTLEFQTAEQIGLRFLRVGEQSGFRRVVAKIALGQGAKTNELDIMLRQKSEVGRFDRRNFAGHRAPYLSRCLAFSASTTTVPRAVLESSFSPYTMISRTP
jgi:hypothetical protein